MFMMFIVTKAGSGSELLQLLVKTDPVVDTLYIRKSSNPDDLLIRFDAFNELIIFELFPLFPLIFH